MTLFVCSSLTLRSYNEQLRLAERKLEFDIDALCEVAAQTLGHAPDQLSAINKIGEGGSYRVLEFIFRDGKSIIARLPYPSLRPFQRAIASEVATMDYLRLRGLPVPKVLAWTTYTETAVGCPYILMERAKGTELSKDWSAMEAKRRLNITKSIGRVEKMLFDLDLPAYGSIYFKDDPTIPKDVGIDISAEGFTQKFVVGPSAEELWYYAGRDSLGISCGPCKSLHYGR